MPPKPKSRPSLAEKRKAGLSNKSAKRKKTDDSVTTPKISSDTAVKKNNVVNLAGKCEPLPDAAYFHPIAVKLFDEVEVYLQLDILIS
jgi:hypothetical protein